MNVDQLFEMPGNALEFLQNVGPERIGNFHMMAAQI
jgi:hypothetical protein